MLSRLYLPTVLLLIAAPASAQDRVIGYDSGDVLESIPDATVDWERISGSSGAYPLGIHIATSTGFSVSGDRSLNLYTGWQENDGELVYRISTESDRVSFWYLLAVGTTDGHQGYYDVSIDGVSVLDGRVPAALYSSGGTGWIYFEITGLDETEHLFEWTLIDRDYYTSSWLFIDDVTFAPVALPDDDGDGVPDDLDICPGGDDNVDADADGLPDACDGCPVDAENDADVDGLCESDDNCPVDNNPDQLDNDQDGGGDACDDDDDNDGVDDDIDNCPFDANGDQSDLDSDGAGDACDADSDGDGVLDNDDACVPSAPDDVVDETGCSIDDLCPCDSDWRNHGAYVRCVTHSANDFTDIGLISQTDHGDITSAAGQSSCGHK